MAALFAISVAAESRQDTAVEIATHTGKVAARLVMPQGTTGRVPVVVFVAGGDEAAMGGLRSLGVALAREGIASLRYEQSLPATIAEGSAEFESAVGEVAATVSFLRNDTRFSTITVAGDAAGSSVAAVAARVSRADASTAFTMASPAMITKTVRDLDLPGVFHPRRNMGQRASLRDTTVATIDSARIAIEYGRPSKRNRVIWGSLVKWGGWWMPGADEASTLTTSRALTFGSLVVPPGDYTLYTQPGADEFMLIVNRETGQFHTVYNADRDVGHVPMTMERVVSLSFSFCGVWISTSQGDTSFASPWMHSTPSPV